MRTKRSNGSTTYTYLYNGSQLTQMTRGSVVMRFSYGTDGRPLVISYNDTPYYYITNLQGDVVAIVNSSGTTVVKYVYDAWGRLLSTTGSMASTLGQYNPLRYRGYIYDQETGLYYLQSRYYNPTWGRFLNADAYTSTGQGMLGNNMFAYCLNNPVNCYDPSGNAAFWTSTGDWNPLHSGYYGNGGAGGGGSGKSGYKDIIDELSDKTNKTLGTIGSVADDCWDAYVQGHYWRQEEQMRQDSAMMELVKYVRSTYEVTQDTAVAKYGKGVLKVRKGVNWVKEGATYILVPCPTIADDLIGMGFVVAGVVYATAGVTEVIICMVYQE